MLTQDPVKIPDIPGKISFVTIDDKEYVRYLIKCKYNAEKKYTEQERVLIGRRCPKMPGLMYPNDNYEQYFGEEEAGINEVMMLEEEAFVRDSGTLELYGPFFDALYYELRAQAKKRPDSPVTRYKAESLNRVLAPLQEMMQEEDYAGLLGLIRTGDGKKGGMSHSDAMILMTQYKSALAKYRRQQLG